jgi:hypothetical protein
VWEKDEIRKDDSFAAFEEVLQLAKQHQVAGPCGRQQLRGRTLRRLEQLGGRTAYQHTTLHAV